MTMSFFFSSSKIKLNKSLPTELLVNASFANALLPNHEKISFSGKYRYTIPPDSTETPLLKLEANVVFGNLEITTE